MNTKLSVHKDIGMRIKKRPFWMDFKSIKEKYEEIS
jgi:hypothetical protein